jgi:DNA replication and repair protein RecF
MGVRSIGLFCFRNLTDAEVPVDAREIFLVGENGQGKTNFLESVYLLAFGSSFRTHREEDLIRRGEAEASIRGVYDEEGRSRSVSLRLRRDGRKEIEVDGKGVADRKALAENIPVILFCHGDLQFVTGPPEQRRWFFNQTQSLFDPLHIDAMRRYRRVLKSRNLALRERRRDLLDIYDRQLAESGLELQKRRAATGEEFNRAFEPIFARVCSTAESLRIVYRPSWPEPTEEAALAALAAARDRDEATSLTSSGPHRDDFRFMASGRDYARLASTGQVRLLALSLRVAQASYVQAMSRRRPVLLLDDVLLELDSGHRERFLEALPRYEQAFFTFLPDERFEAHRRPSTLVYNVHGGRLTAWNA